MKLVVCIGSDIGSDSFGFKVAERIRGKVNARLEVVTNYIDILTLLYDERYDMLIVVDAVRGEEDYRLVEFEVKTSGVVKAFLSHSISFFDAIKLAKALGILPGRVIVVGMGMSSLEVNEEKMDEVVELAAERVTELCSE